MVLWDPEFTSDSPEFHLSSYPDETKTMMVKNYLGLDLTKEQEQADALSLTHPIFGINLRIASWDVFQEVATDEQLRVVKSFIKKYFNKI